MSLFFKSRLMKSIYPYFILALGVIVAYRLTAEIPFFVDAAKQFGAIITPFLIGGIFAYILNLPCSALERLIKKMDNSLSSSKKPYLRAVMRFVSLRSRAFSVLLLIIIVALIVALVLNILIPAVVGSITLFISEISNFEATIRGWIEGLEQLGLPDFITEQLNVEAIFSTIFGWAEDFSLEAIFSTVISGIGNVGSAIFQGILIIISSIYFLVEKDRLKTYVMKFIAAASSKATGDTILKYSRKLDFNFRQYILAQTIDGIILGSIMTIVLLLFGSPYAIVLGLILGVVNYIPIFGSIFGTALAVLVIAFTQGIPTAALAAVIMFAIQQFDGSFIQPKLMGKTFSLSPLLVIITVTIVMNYAGVMGMLVSIPILAILKDLLDSYIAHKEANYDKTQSVKNNSDETDSSYNLMQD